MVLATFWAQATYGVTYVRCNLPARHLPGQVCTLSALDAKWVGGDEIVFPRQRGAAVWSFVGNTTRALLMAEMANQGIPVFVEMDDNYRMDPPRKLSSWKQTRADRTPVVQTGLYSGLPDRVVEWQDDSNYQTATDAVRMADGLIVSTPKLAEAYADDNENIHVCENTVDPDDWPEPPEPSEKLRIGWAASDSHMYDAPIIRDALAWASSKKNIEVVIMGIHPESTRYRFPYRYIPWANNHEQYRHSLGEIDVMLCPLRRGEWEDCKSDIKCLEASMAGACAIVSESPAFSLWFDQPAYVARNDWDFTRLVKHLARNQDEARETAKLAREYVLDKRTIQGNIWKWREAIS